MGNNHEGKKTTVVQKTVQGGVSLGAALAMIISYTAHQSIGWAIVHGILGWIYVIYDIIKNGWR